MFDDISEDEYSDHAAKLIEYARSLNLEYPNCNAEYERFASESAVKAFRVAPKASDLSVQLKYALDLERDAILSYREALSRAYECDEFDEKIISILVNNLKDEIEHFEKISIALEGESELKI